MCVRRGDGGRGGGVLDGGKGKGGKERGGREGDGGKGEGGGEGGERGKSAKCCVMLYNAVWYCVMLCNVVSCYVEREEKRLCCVVLCYVVKYSAV